MTESLPTADKESLSDLTFGPGWARAPSNVPTQAPSREGEGRDRRRGGGGDRGDRGSHDRRRTPDARRTSSPREGSEGGRSIRSFKEQRAAFSSASARESLPDIPGTIEFLPERRGLAPLAHRLAASGRAFSLFEVAGMFLSKPDYYTVRLTLEPSPEGTPGVKELIQCEDCKALFLDREIATAHAFERHFDRFYRREEIEAEPPKGNFTCVARCMISGELLGPPNYHGFQERFTSLHHARFSHLSSEDYGKKIENVYDAALVEQWKESMKRQTVYYPLQGPEGAPSFSRGTDVEKDFREKHAPSLIRTGLSFIIPGTMACSLEDQRLKAAIRQAWNQEVRFPLRLSIAIRLAFRRLGLHLFKTADGSTYLTSICPSAIDPTQAIPTVREILEYLTAHSGTTRQELLAAVRPGLPPEDPQVFEAAKAVRWLVGKGHVIEFSNGKLSIPDASLLRVQHARRRQQRPVGRRGGIEK